MSREFIDDRDGPRPDLTRPPEPHIHYAARKGDLDLLAELLDGGADVNERADLEHDFGANLKNLTTLMVAARSIDGATVETLRWLVAHGADIHARAQGGNTAAWYAAGHGGRWWSHKRAVTSDHMKRLRYLLDLGLEQNENSDDVASLLTEACSAGDPDRVRLLLERGANARSRESLFHAAASGSADCVKVLLDAGADPNGRGACEATPLMYAGSAAVVHTLLNAGAEIDATDRDGDDVLEALLHERYGTGHFADRLAAAHALVEAGAELERYRVRTRLASAAFSHNVEAVEFLLAHGIDATEVDVDGTTALHSICWQGEYQDELTNNDCERIIRLLVAAGTPLNAADQRGNTALHEAAAGDWGNPTAIRTLLELGAAADVANEVGDTPLILAAQNRRAAHSMDLLLRAGADPHRRNDAGKTAITAAAEYLEGHRRISNAEFDQWQRVLDALPGSNRDELLLENRDSPRGDVLTNGERVAQALRRAARDTNPDSVSE